MPLVKYSLEVMKGLLNAVRKDKDRTGEVLCLSYPDLIISPKSLFELYGQRMHSIKMREDGTKSINWHKANSITTEVPDTADFFHKLGFKMTAVDMVEGRGGEVIHDLNRPLPVEFYDQFDLVFDCISNQCFNVAQCMASACYACRPGGYIMHVIPMQMVNQGFWNVSPTAYHDFYAANGFDIVRCEYIVGVYERKATLHLDSVRRLRNVPDDTMNLIVAEKQDMPSEVVWPMMRKFEMYPKCQIDKPNLSML